MLPRVLSLDERIRKSELFPRIRDAEAGMIKNEQDFQKKRKQQKKLQEQRHKMDLKVVAIDDHLSPIKQENHYFTGFVLNKDPSCSTYMPFDAVYFPKLFNKVTKRAPPETIKNLWMLGFEDHAYRSQQPKEVHHDEHTQMDVSTVVSIDSSLKPGKVAKKRHHKFEAIYSNKSI